MRFLFLSLLIHLFFCFLLRGRGSFFSSHSKNSYQKISLKLSETSTEKKRVGAPPVSHEKAKTLSLKEKPSKKPLQEEKVKDLKLRLSELSEKEVGEEELAAVPREQEPHGKKGFGFQKNLEEDPVLLSFLPPEYTEEALEAELFGKFEVKVFVSKVGQVLQVKITKPIGYGMDEELTLAMKEALFTPGKDSDGNTREAWAQVEVVLEMF